MRSIRLAELVTALSLATDLGSGVPMEMMLATCLVSLRLGEALGLDDEELRQAYYLSLLRHAGCTAESQRAAELVGDELATTRAFFSMDPARPVQMMGVLWRRVVPTDRSPPQRARLFTQLLSELPAIAVAHCEVAQLLAGRLGLDEAVRTGLTQFPERWDGRGFPLKLRGEAILRPVRVAQVAQEGVVQAHFFGAQAAVAAVRARAGVTLDPAIAERFCADAVRLLDLPASVRDEVLAVEPGPRPFLGDPEIEAAARALADLADLQTPFSTGHSSAVAGLAQAAGRQAGLPDSQLTLLRRAGYLHDLGRVAISAGVWAKAGPLTEADWERVRLHPYYAQRILAQPAPLAEVGSLASAHHERLDGSGYHRNLAAAALTPSMCLLAAAEAFQAMCEDRPYRAALAPEQAAAELKREARAGRLDGDAVNAVLAAAGQAGPLPHARRQRVANLTGRELEVLRLVARGQTNPEIARELTISRKTVSRHLESIYAKLDVSTRAAATYFAMQHHLV